MSAESHEKAVFDKAGVWERLDNDEALFRELVKVFDAEWPRNLAEVKRAVDLKDAPDLDLRAHALKGALGNVGAESAAEAARALEFAGKQRKLEKAHEMYQLLSSEIERFRGELRKSGYL